MCLFCFWADWAVLGSTAFEGVFSCFKFPLTDGIFETGAYGVPSKSQISCVCQSKSIILYNLGCMTLVLASEEKAVGKTKTTFSFILLSFPLTAKLALCHCCRRHRAVTAARLRRAIAQCRTATASPAYSPPLFSPLAPVSDEGKRPWRKGKEKEDKNHPYLVCSSTICSRYTYMNYIVSLLLLATVCLDGFLLLYMSSSVLLFYVYSKAFLCLHGSLTTRFSK